MKIGLWTSVGDRCGIAAYSSALRQELEELGLRITVVQVPYTERDTGMLSERVAHLNSCDLIHIQHEYTFFGGIAPGVSSLPRLLKQLERPHVVTAHTVFTSTELLRVDSETRPRQKLAKHVLARVPAYRKSVERDPFASARAVIVHTELAANRLAAWRIPRDRIHVIPAGAPVPSRAADPAQIETLRRRLKLENARVMAIFGFLSPDKGYELALEALKELPAAVHLLIAGGVRVESEAPYLKALEEEIKARSLQGRVTITGYLETRDLPEYFALADLVLVPHTAANGSYSVVVALAHGAAVLASDLACFQELNEQHGCVDLFAAGDARALRERMSFLLASAGSRTRLRQAAQKFAEERSWRSVAIRTRAIYEGIRGANLAP